MANLLTHRLHSAKVDGADATQVQPSNWNDDHVFAAGGAGQVLTCDPTVVPSGAKWATLPPGTPGGGNLNDVLTRDPSIVPAGSKWAPIPAALPPGGVLGDILTRDATVATYGSKWVTPAVPTWPAWIGVAYLGDWRDAGAGNAIGKYRHDPTGRLVYLSGIAVSPSQASGPGSPMFTLPVGYRPTSILSLTGGAFVGAVRTGILINIPPSGIVNVDATAGATTYVSFEGLCFAIDQ